MENLIEEIDVVIKKYLDDRVQVDVNYRESFIRKLSEKVDDVAVTLERADRISHSAFVDVQELNKQFTAVEELHIRDANRIASLELTVMGLNEGLFDAERNANRIAKLEREITELHNSYLVNRESQKIENDRLLTRESIEKSGISSSRVTDLLHAAKKVHGAVCEIDRSGRVCLAKSFPEILSVAQMYGRADEFLDSLGDRVVFDEGEETFTITLPLSSKNVLEVAIDHEIEHHDGLICDPHHCDGEKIEFKARRRALCSIKEDF